MEPSYKILLVEDDEDDYVLTKSLVAGTKGSQFQLEWVQTFDRALELMTLNRHDVCLVDYRLGPRDGLELLRLALAQGCQSPVIMLTGQGEHEIDLAAMQAGAADYLVKAQLEKNQLERTLRYALDRRRAAAAAAFEHARLAAFGAEVGLSLTGKDSLREIMRHCTGAMVKYLNASHAQILAYDATRKVFEPLAATHSGGSGQPELNIPLPQFCSDVLADQKPIYLADIRSDARFEGWQNGSTTSEINYAGCPLVLEERLIGVMLVLGTNSATDAVLAEMQSVSHGIALCIQRHRSQEALEASEAKYKVVVENIKEVIFQIDQWGNWTFLNPAWEEMTGFKVAETIGTAFIEYLHHDDRDQNLHILYQLFERKLSFSCHELRFLSQGGQLRCVEAYLQLLLSPDGEVSGVTGTLTDITERRKNEIQIQKLAAFPSHNPNPVLEFSAAGNMTYFNNAALELARSLGKASPLEILPPNAPQMAQQCLSHGQNKLRVESVVGGKTISWSFFPIVSGEVVHCYGSDITERLNLEAQFRHAQKLESIGQLAAGIAHDFNNLLTVIQGNIDHLLMRGTCDSATAQQLNQVSSASRRAANLTRQLLAFSRKQVMQVKSLPLNGVLQSVEKILPRLLGENLKLTIQCGAGLPNIVADAGMIEQVVMNLAVNSRDAMPRGGQLILATTEIQIDDTAKLQNPSRRTGQFICLSASDTGCGMSRETLGRIFEPFFTTKGVGKGTGLGLATVFGIVQQHHGWIEVESELNLGTTFKIFFPADAQRSSVVPEDDRPAAVVRGRNETILVVEDEYDLRMLVKRMLKEFGYEVLEAAHGPAALQVWDAHHGDIDLVLADIVMPEGMNGIELGAKLKARRPSLKIIYTTGYNPTATEHDFKTNENLFLFKPYSLQKLSQTVRDCLDK